MPIQSDSLKTTAPIQLHRFYLCVYTTKQWYEVMRVCRDLYSNDWQTESKIKRKLTHWTRSAQYNTSYHGHMPGIWCWFDVPDDKFGTWVKLKMPEIIVGTENHWKNR